MCINYFDWIDWMKPAVRYCKNTTLFFPAFPMQCTIRSYCMEKMRIILLKQNNCESVYFAHIDELCYSYSIINIITGDYKKSSCLAKAFRCRHQALLRRNAARLLIWIHGVQLKLRNTKSYYFWWLLQTVVVVSSIDAKLD